MASSGGDALPSEPIAQSDVPEETHVLRDVTIRARETRPGFFEATLRPTSPETHLARNGYTLDTGQQPDGVERSTKEHAMTYLKDLIERLGKALRIKSPPQLETTHQGSSLRPRLGVGTASTDSHLGPVYGPVQDPR